MVQFLKEIILETKSQVKVNLSGQMVINTWVNFEKIKRMDKELWNLAMEDSIEAIGLMTKCTEMVNLFGLQEKVIKEDINEI